MEDVRVLLAKIEGGIENLQHRLDDHRRLADQQHSENVGRLQSIEREVRVTNGRVNGHDTKLSMHEASIAALKRAAGVTLNEVVRYIACISGTYLVLKALGLLK
jgi:hypothetical protein